MEESMATLTIRNIESKVVNALKRRAKANKRSLEAELRVIVGDAAFVDQDFVLSEMRRIRAMTPKDRAQTDSVEIIRQMRKERDEQLYRRR
jgi:plasmid stability protein